MNKRILNSMVLGAALLMTPQLSVAKDAGLTRIENQVRHEIVMLPYYSLFDHFTYRVDGSHVTLLGKVNTPTLKSDAERVVKRIEGVHTVSNQIEVLPASPNDDRLRMTLYRAIYGHTAMQTLSIQAVPPIHIIVENGNVTLEGMTGTAMQKQIAGMQASSVAGVFSVTNNLSIDTK